MKVQRKQYKSQVVRSSFEAKFNLKNALAAMEQAVYKQKEKYIAEESCVKIQRLIRTYLNKRRFKRSLFKLLILKNIVDSKLHRDNMRVYRAF